MLKKTLFLVIVLCFSLAPFALAQDIAPNDNTIEDQKVHLELEKITEENDQIYESKLKEMNTILDNQLKQFNVSSYDQLSKNQADMLKDLEHKLWLEAIAAVEKNYEKNGWKSVENEDESNSVMSTPGNMSVTDKLYTKGGGYFKFEGYWNWTNGTYDTFKSTYDIAAFRALYKPASIISSSIKAWDMGGNSRNSYVSKRKEVKNGIIFNVDDQLTKIPSGPAVFYTDSGTVSVELKDSGYNKYFLNYEHNYKSGALVANASINLTDLSSSELIVKYDVTPKKWQKESNGRVVN